MLEFMAMILLPAVPEGTKEWRSGRKSGERGVKMVRNVTRLQGYKVTRLQGYKVTKLQGYKVTRWNRKPLNLNSRGCHQEVC
jgi:hypothetical protein